MMYTVGRELMDANAVRILSYDNNGTINARRRRGIHRGSGNE